MFRLCLAVSVYLWSGINEGPFPCAEAVRAAVLPMLVFDRPPKPRLPNWEMRDEPRFVGLVLWSATERVTAPLLGRTRVTHAVWVIGAVWPEGSDDLLESYFERGLSRLVRAARIVYVGSRWIEFGG